jgi:HNH/Endo VII superfamily toxin with a SHH signature
MQSHHPEQQTALSRNIANYSPADDPALLMQTPQHRATFAPQAAQRARGAAFEMELGTPAALEEASQIMTQAGVSPATAGQTVMEHSGYLFSTTPVEEVLVCLPP